MWSTFEYIIYSSKWRLVEIFIKITEFNGQMISNNFSCALNYFNVNVSPTQCAYVSLINSVHRPEG